MIRKATPKDAVIIAKAWREYLQETKFLRGLHTPSEDDYTYWYNILSQPINNVIVKISRNKVVAFSRASLMASPVRPPIIYISELYVPEKYKKLESQLIDSQVNWGTKQGAKAVQVITKVGSDHKKSMETKGFKAITLGYIMEV